MTAVDRPAVAEGEDLAALDAPVRELFERVGRLNDAGCRIPAIGAALVELAADLDY